MGGLAVLVSGTGSILQAIIDYPIKVELVLADRDCLAADIAYNAGIWTGHVYRKDFDPIESNRIKFSAEILNYIREHDCDVVAMAGFMTVLSHNFFEGFHGITLNTHPSLLPKYKGKNAVRNALLRGEKITGCTIHVVTLAVDSGRILGQSRVRIRKDDTVESLHERIKAKECILYPKIIKHVLNSY